MHIGRQKFLALSVFTTIYTQILFSSSQILWAAMAECSNTLLLKVLTISETILQIEVILKVQVDSNVVLISKFLASASVKAKLSSQVKHQTFDNPVFPLG